MDFMASSAYGTVERHGTPPDCGGRCVVRHSQSRARKFIHDSLPTSQQNSYFDVARSAVDDIASMYGPRRVGYYLEGVHCWS